VLPNIKLIENMIKDYTDSPMSYTLDVAVTENNETCLLEVHPFVSCGLYGFADYRLLPTMFTTGYNWFKEESIVKRIKN